MITSHEWLKLKPKGFTWDDILAVQVDARADLVEKNERLVKQIKRLKKKLTAARADGKWHE